MGMAHQSVVDDYAESFMGNMFLMMMDSYSKCLEVYLMMYSNTEATLVELRIAFSTHNLAVVTDNGTCFTSQKFDEFIKQK